MAFKVHVGLPQITVHQGQTVLVTWAIYSNGVGWEPLTGGSMLTSRHTQRDNTSP
jgi:hypothetical protein